MSVLLFEELAAPVMGAKVGAKGAGEGFMGVGVCAMGAGVGDSIGGCKSCFGILLEARRQAGCQISALEFTRRRVEEDTKLLAEVVDIRTIGKGATRSKSASSEVAQERLGKIGI